jgi:hypothetical protein
MWNSFHINKPYHHNVVVGKKNFQSAKKSRSTHAHSHQEYFLIDRQRRSLYPACSGSFTFLPRS